MSINELYEILIDKFSNDELIGELTINGNCIIWSYVYDSNDVADIANDCDEFDFESEYSSTSTEEILNDVYYDDKDKILTFMDEINIYDIWFFSEYDIYKNCISFKIY